MQSVIWKFLIALLCFVLRVQVSATELHEVHKNVRALGMGNAFTSLVEGEEALFFNPAGLAKTSGVFWTIVDPAVGSNSLDGQSYTNYLDLKDPATFESALNDLYGEPLWVAANAKSAFAMPYLAAAIYKDLDASVIIDNPVAPSLYGNVILDQGIAVGGGFTMGTVQFGGVVKRIHRIGGRQTFGPGTIAAVLEGTEEPNVIFDELEREGLGYSLDLGANMTLPGPIQPTFSFVWKNVGNTKFTSLTEGEPPPPTDEQEWILGASLMVDAFLVHIVPSIEFKHLDKSDEQLGKKVHFGVEVGLPLMDLRAGFHQGYLTYGAGIDMGFLQIDAASWGVELGEYPGQFEDRRYMLQATIRLGFDMGFGSDVSGGSGSASGRSGSRRRVKLRR